MGLFKAYDVRGIVPDQLNEEIAFGIGFGFAKLLAEETENPRVAVGIDARPTGPGLAAAFMDGLAAAHATPEFIGPCSTPMLYWAVAGRELKSDGGAMITASHNPARYNGIKFCRENAIPVAQNSGLVEVEKFAAEAPKLERPFKHLPTVPLYTETPGEVAAPLGLHPGLFAGYLEHIRKFVRRIPDDLSVAIDTANGMGGIYLGVLRSLGLRLHAINSECDGTFPNHEANPSKLDNLQPLCDLVKRENCAFGIALDGDADRAVFIDETGTPVGQDMITALLAKEHLSREKGATILFDLRSSRAVAEVIEADGGRPLRERVGHSFMKATMRKVGCVFGGELAGHYYFKENFYADSAILAVVELLNALGHRSEPLSELIRPLKRYFQTGEINFKVAESAKIFAKVEKRFKDGKIDHLDGVTVQYPDWWFNLRASNTEPYVRLNMEANSRDILTEKFALVREMLGGPEE